MTIYFTSDQHYFHGKVKEDGERTGALRFGLRQDFECVEEMNETMIAMHNGRVRPQDTVYYLGDLSFGNAVETLLVLNCLNGTKIWVPGNHDEKLLKDDAVRGQFKTIAPFLDVKFGDQRVTRRHYPLLTWNKAHHGAWMLHGHSHGNCQYPHPWNRILDVGVDTHNFMPYSFDEIREYMLARKYQSVDHHKEKQDVADSV